MQIAGFHNTTAAEIVKEVFLMLAGVILAFATTDAFADDAGSKNETFDAAHAGIYRGYVQSLGCDTVAQT